MTVAARFAVHGIVQGVGFRAFVQAEARRLGLRGWVRNRDDGAVEVLATGTVAALNDLEEALRQGPRWARVERVERRPSPEATGSGFHIV